MGSLTRHAAWRVERGAGRGAFDIAARHAGRDAGAALAPEQVAALSADQLAGLTTTQVSATLINAAGGAGARTTRRSVDDAGAIAGSGKSRGAGRQPAGRNHDNTTGRSVGSTIPRPFGRTDHGARGHADRRARRHADCGLSAASVSGLETHDIANLTSTQLAALTAGQLGGLAETQLAALSTEQIEALSTTQVRGFTASDIGLLADTQTRRVHFEPAQGADLDADKRADGRPGLGAHDHTACRPHLDRAVRLHRDAGQRARR